MILTMDLEILKMFNYGSVKRYIDGIFSKFNGIMYT